MKQKLSERFDDIIAHKFGDVADKYGEAEHIPLNILEELKGVLPPMPTLRNIIEPLIKEKRE